MIAALDRTVDDLDADLARPGSGRLAALLGVVAAAAALAVLPALLAAGAGREVAGGFAGLVAVVGGFKLAAMAWGLAASAD